MRTAMSLENATNRRKRSHPRPPGLAAEDTAPVHPECSHSLTRGAKAPGAQGRGSPACRGGLWSEGKPADATLGWETNSHG